MTAKPTTRDDVSLRSISRKPTIAAVEEMRRQVLGMMHYAGTSGQSDLAYILLGIARDLTAALNLVELGQMGHTVSLPLERKTTNVKETRNIG